VRLAGWRRCRPSSGVVPAGLGRLPAGEPYQKSDGVRAFNEYILGQVPAGVTWLRSVFVRGPLRAITNAGMAGLGAISEASVHHNVCPLRAENPDPPDLPSSTVDFDDAWSCASTNYEQGASRADPGGDPAGAEHVR